jgi:hypothetical protein
MPDDQFTEDSNQVGALHQFAPKVREVLCDYRNKRQLASLAKKIGVHPSRLTEMITKDATGNYKRMITPYYLAKLINEGVVNIQMLMEDNRLDDLPDRAKVYLERMALSRKTIQLVLEAQQRGIDVDLILENILYPAPG